jgi:CheY-like chemotaxis protein
MPSEAWDMTNFGLFSGDDDLGGAVALRLFEKVEELKGKKLVISECGHGYRSTRCEGPNWAQYDVPFEMESSVETMLRFIREGRIKVDKSRNKEPVTFHDSCNLARSCGITEEPRELLDLVCEDFREMYPNRAENYCCTGGGGAMSMSEYTPRRLKSAKVKAEQLKATGAKIVVTSCHNCVDGLTDLIRHYKLDMKVAQLVNLVADVLIIEEKVVEEIPAVPVEVTERLPLAGRTVVVADDEPDQLLYLASVLEDNGATVIQATNSDEALELARREKPDLLTLDLAMPGRDVAEVYDILRADPELADLKICIITGRPEMRKVIYERVQTAPDGYLDKPVSEENLVRGLRKILEVT